MLPTRATSPTRSCDAFLARAQGIVEQLDFFAELDPQDCRWPLAGELRAMERVILDVQAECASRGGSGALLYRQASSLWGQLERCIRAHDAGDLSPWRAARDGVARDLDALRQLVAPRIVVKATAQPAPQGPPRVAVAARPLAVARQVKAAGNSPRRAAATPQAAPRRRGRGPKLSGDRAQDRAAFWMLVAPDLVADGDDLKHTLDGLGDEPRPRDVYEAMKLHGCDIAYSAVRNKPPRCWPRGRDGEPLPEWRFEEYAVDVSVESFERNLRRYRDEIAGRPTHPRATADNVEPPGDRLPLRSTTPSRQRIRRITIIGQVEAAEEAIGAVRTARHRGVDDRAAWDALRAALAKLCQGDESVVRGLLVREDDDTLESLASHLVKVRQQAGDTGDCGRRNRRP